MARLFVSDVHLDGGAPEAIEQFLDFLKVHALHAEALYILGDLFETWVGDDDADPAKARVCSSLRELTACGVAVFIIHGNRDFLLGRDFCRRTGCELLTDPTIVELDGESVLLTHGDALCTDDHAYQALRASVRTGCELLSDPIIVELDGESVLVTHGDALCTDDRAYQALRASVRTRAWQRRFLALPIEARARLANQARAGSQAHTARVVPQIMDVNAHAVATSFRALAVRRMIHGHTHRPAIHDDLIDGERVQRIVLGAWYEQGSYLWYERGRYELRELRR